MLLSGVLTLVACVLSESTERVTIDLDMFRAMGVGNGDVNKFTTENDDTGDLAGVIKYVHTEVIAEHIIGTPDRKSRKYWIDAWVSWRFKVQNTPGLLEEEGHNIDFGNFLAFDQGQNTLVNGDGDRIISQYGDYVGIQPEQGDARLPAMGPFYWMDVSGFCPNLPWFCTKGYPGCEDAHPTPHTARCDYGHPCPGKGTRENPRTTPNNPQHSCLRYDMNGKFAMGGLCSQEDETVLPNGTLGCVYNYLRSTSKKVMIDDVVGITSEDCQDRSDNAPRKCKDWLDFRKHCTNKKGLAKMFGGDGIIQNNVGFCVEYDIHPKCVNNCDHPDCKAAIKNAAEGGPPIEVGLPFWQGRCNAMANQKRFEHAASFFGVHGAKTEHKNTQADILKNPAKCDGRGLKGCKPDGEVGGPYCTRHWSGVCTPCYIPGTTSPFPDAPPKGTAPVCPTDILDYPEYKGLNEPKCQQADKEGNLHAKDLCCLYMNACQNRSSLHSQLDENGFAYAWSKMSTQGIIDFFTVLMQKKYNTPYVINQAALEEFFYWKWFPGQKPMLSPADFDGIAEKIKGFYSATSPAPTPAPPTPAPANTGGDDGNSIPYVPIAIGAAVVVVVGIGAALFVQRNATRRREAALLETVA